jgi:hypothetical protein
MGRESQRHFGRVLPLNFPLSRAGKLRFLVCFGFLSLATKIFLTIVNLPLLNSPWFWNKVSASRCSRWSWMSSIFPTAWPPPEVSWHNSTTSPREELTGHVCYIWTPKQIWVSANHVVHTVHWLGNLNEAQTRKCAEARVTNHELLLHLLGIREKGIISSTGVPEDRLSF